MHGQYIHASPGYISKTEQMIIEHDFFYTVKKQAGYVYCLGILVCVVKPQRKAELLIQNEGGT